MTDAAPVGIDVMDHIQAILRELDDLEPRLGQTRAGEVELSLLERATELVEQAQRLLERMDRGSG